MKSVKSAFACTGLFLLAALLVAGAAGFGLAQAAEPQAQPSPRSPKEYSAPLAPEGAPSRGRQDRPGGRLPLPVAVPDTTANFEKPEIVEEIEADPAALPGAEPVAAAPIPQPMPVPTPASTAEPIKPGTNPTVTPAANTQSASPTGVMQPDKVTLDDVRDKLVVTRDEVWLFRDQMQNLDLLRQYNTRQQQIMSVQ